MLGALQKALSLADSAVARSDVRAQEGLARLKEMRKSAGPFVAHPQAGTSFDRLLEEDPASVAHEFMGADWLPLHSADVVGRMQAIGCKFAGSATPEENIDALSLPSAAIGAVRKASSAALRETLKDIARDQTLRRELYVRDGGVLDASEHLSALRGLIFRLRPQAPMAVPLVFQTRMGPMEGAAEIFGPLLQRLCRGTASFADLETLPRFVKRPDLLNQALTMPLGAGFARPVRTKPDSAAAQRFERVVHARKRQGLSYSTSNP